MVWQHHFGGIYFAHHMCLEWWPRLGVQSFVSPKMFNSHHGGTSNMFVVLVFLAKVYGTGKWLQKFIFPIHSKCPPCLHRCHYPCNLLGNLIISFGYGLGSFALVYPHIWKRLESSLTILNIAQTTLNIEAIYLPRCLEGCTM